MNKNFQSGAEKVFSSIVNRPNEAASLGDKDIKTDKPERVQRTYWISKEADIAVKLAAVQTGRKAQDLVDEAIRSYFKSNS